MIIKILPKYLVSYFLVLGLLILCSRLSPFWYDDTGHSLVVYQLYQTGIWAFPTEYPYLSDYDCFSTMISIGPVLHYPASWFISITDWDFHYLRFYMAFLNAFLPFCIYTISKDFFPPRSALWAAVLSILNVQFWIYGSQYLGEIILIQWILWGIYFQWLTLIKQKKIIYLCLSQIFFYLAILTKEYIALPLGLYLFFAWIYWSIIHKKWLNALLLQGVLLPVAPLLFYYIHFQDFISFQKYWELKKDYQSEFLYLNTEPLLFLIKKPLILIGYVTMIIKWLIKKRKEDFLLGILQTLFLVFFLISKGFDRFGFLLFPIASLYVSEWLPFLWNFVFKTLFLKIIFVATSLVLFAQNLVNPFYWESQWKKNEYLKLLAYKIQTSNIPSFFTYEIELIPYLKNLSIRTSSIPPVSSHRIKEKIKENYFLIGEYAQTEYSNTWNKEDYIKIGEYGNYTMWKLREVRNLKN
ncbi:MAG: hypothetical protein KatS3mg035_0951 [Bacteroidia bacterium]|nr:MAG: hypothetical protein KatS3mg035_0951 [Bacteroidia bacterium]